MRRLISAGLAALMFTVAVPATAATGLELFLKVPWSLGIHLYQWMSRDQKKVLYVEVMAEGADLEAARQSAFRMAVERAVGVIVSSETEVRDQKIRRDDIITYASGFVSDYKLVDQAQRGGRTCKCGHKEEELHGPVECRAARGRRRGDVAKIL